MKNISLWNDYKNSFNANSLDENKSFDVVIIGGGITGVSCAYHLRNSGLNVGLFEKNKVGRGVTSRTTGKLTYLQDNIYTKLFNYHGKDKSFLYLKSQIDAINLVKDIIYDNNISCDLQKVRSYVFSFYGDKKVSKEAKLLKNMKVNVKETTKIPGSNKVISGYYIDDSYVFHPLKYLNRLAEIAFLSGVKFYENTRIISIDRNNGNYYLKSDKYNMKVKYVIIASHYPYFTIPFLMPLKCHLEKSYIGAKKVSKDYMYSAISVSKPVISIRFHNENDQIYKLFLTNSHNYAIKNNEAKNFNEYLNGNYEYLWSNKDIITNDFLPYIGEIKDNLFIATGYNTWGMTNGSLAGKIISDIIICKKNPYVLLFDPKRNINIGSLINFPIALGSSIYMFFKSKIKKNKAWYPNNVIFEKRNGKNVAIYIDEDNKEHIVYNLCPHLKCSLIFNEIEKTWDCPCHGSRFDIDGNSIEGPSNYDIKYKE